MKKWTVLLFMTLSFSNQSFTADLKNIILQEGANLPISQLTLFVPLGTALLDKVGGETSLLKKIISQSILGETIEKHGGNYSINFSSDSFLFHITILDEEMSGFLKEFIPQLQKFVIDETSVELSKKQLLEDINSFNSNPNRKSFGLFTAKLFGNHPYGRPKLGTAETVPSIKIEDLNNIWQMLFSDKTNIYMILASSQSTKFKKDLESIWQTFPVSSQSIPVLDDIELLNKEVKWNTKDPILSQSFINVGFLLPPIPLEQKHLMMMFQEIVGGGFNSRLFKILRAQYGLSYSPHSMYASAIKGDIFNILYSTKSKSAQESLKVVYSILDDLKVNGITQDEFDTTKKLVYNSILRLEENNASLNQLIASDILYLRPLGSIKILETKIRESTKEDLNNFIKNLLNTYPSAQFILGES